MWIKASGSAIRFIVPNAPIVSYSGRCVCRGYGYFGSMESLDSAPHAIGQRKHPYDFSIRGLIVEPPSIFLASGKSTTPTPPQFFTGESPLIALPAVIPVVP